MRTLLVTALLATASLLPSPDAEACGGYIREPAVWRVHNHAAGQAFVVTGPAEAPAGSAWRVLQPRSFERTQIASGAKLARPIAFTLVGPGGVRIVSSTQRVFLAKRWQAEETVSAFEVRHGASDPEVHFAVAIEGSHADATWIELARGEATTELTAWAQMTEGKDSTVEPAQIASSGLQTLTVYGGKSGPAITVLRRGKKLLGRYAGRPLGAVTSKGTTWLMIADGDRIERVYLGNQLTLGA